MSDTETTPNPRRSQRDRKTAKPFQSVNSSLRASKRKRSASDAEEEPEINEEELTDPEDSASAPEDEDEEPENYVKKPRAAPKKPRVKKGPAAAGPPAVKKPRTKAPRAPRKVASAPRKTKKAGVTAGGAGATDFAKDTKIASDNVLFNAIMNPAAALQSTVEDFLESLEQTPAPAQADLINCILRACGCNDVVDGDKAVDHDGILDALDDFTEGLKQDDSPVYPLTSKLPIFKKFRKSLTEFLSRLISSAAELGLLYSSDMLVTLQAWVVSMSSSRLRSFRHTATVVALEVQTALCDVAAAVEKEAEVVGRQREGERKRKAGGKGAGGREKELEGKAAEVRERRTQLAEYLKEFIDGVFVHRYRDLDPHIRSECVLALGRWFKKYPAHFLDGQYLRYVGWLLSDGAAPVRLEAVRALAEAYARAEHIGSLTHFTERFKPRLVEMARRDVELPVRVAVVQVLGAIDGHGLLDDEQREELCLLVFDGEAKVRRAVSGFVRGVWEDALEERLLGRKASDQEKGRAGAKVLGTLLVKWGKGLDRAHADAESGAEDAEGETESQSSLGAGAGAADRVREPALLVGVEREGRIALAVEALWDEIDPIGDWEALLELLLLDHSAAEEAPTTGRRRKKAQASQDTVVDEAWRLEEVEESVLLQVLVSALRKAKADATGAKKGEDDTIASELTRALMKALPRLFVKHQTDQNRIFTVLLIPQMMDLEMYLEMRMITAYSSLWDDLSKQFLSHSSPTVLTQAVVTMRHLMNVSSLSNTNSTKILELEDELASSLRDVVAGRDELDMASFTEDEVLSLTAICARLCTLAGMRDMTAWAEEDESGKQSSVWDILSALAERGKLGYKEEETMVENALNFLTRHVMWKTRGLTVAADPSPEEVQFREKLQEQRNILLEKVIEYAVGTQSNTIEGVKRAAFRSLMTLHVLFCSAETLAADGLPLPTASLSLTLDDEVQYRCAGYVQAEIERYAEQLDDGSPATREKGKSDPDSSSDEDDRQPTKAKGKAAAGAEPANGGTSTRRLTKSKLKQEYAFMSVVSVFLQAICAGAIQIRHGVVLLAHYGRLGSTFDSCTKALVDVLRSEGMYQDNGRQVAEVIVQAMRESFVLLLDGVVRTEEHAVALGKLLMSCIMIRGAQLAVVKRLGSDHIVAIHTALLTWIGKRIAAYETNKNKKSRNMAILFFKALVPLLTSIDSRDALRIKAHMDQVLAQAKVEISATSRVWEPQRAYEKKLGAALSKDKASGLKGKKAKTGKSADVLTTDDEGGLTDGASTAPAPRRRAPVRSVRRNASDTEGDASTGSDREHLEGDAQPTLAPVSPLKPRPRARRKVPPPKSVSPEAREGSSARSSPLSQPSTTTPEPEPRGTPEEDPDKVDESVVTPKTSRKRPRNEETDNEDPGAPAADGDTPTSPALSQISQHSEIVIKRKRTRR